MLTIWMWILHDAAARKGYPSSYIPHIRSITSNISHDYTDSGAVSSRRSCVDLHIFHHLSWWRNLLRHGPAMTRYCSYSTTHHTVIAVALSAHHEALARLCVTMILVWWVVPCVLLVLGSTC